MKRPTLVPVLFAMIPLLFTACNRGENGGGFFQGPTPTLQFVKDGEGGCADVLLFKATADQREYLVVNADKTKLNLPEIGAKTFELADAPDGLLVRIDLRSSASKFTPYCNCVSDGSKREATWNAKSGKVTITLHEPLKDQNGPMRRYKASAKLENVVFHDDAGRKTALKEATITEIVVGWYAG